MLYFQHFFLSHICGFVQYSHRGIKKTLLFNRDNTVKASLEQVKMLNTAMLHSADLSAAMAAFATKSKPTFSGH